MVKLKYMYLTETESRGDVEYEDSAQLERTMFSESGNTDVK